jgi:hypothetical protein
MTREPIALHVELASPRYNSSSCGAQMYGRSILISYHMCLSRGGCEFRFLRIIVFQCIDDPCRSVTGCIALRVDPSVYPRSALVYIDNRQSNDVDETF